MQKSEREEIMESKARFVSVSLALALVSALGAARVSAQHLHDHGNDERWKTGMLRISQPAWAGDVRLKSGMYHVKHVVDGDKHWIVFKSVILGAGYREGSMFEEKEIVRLECRVEPATESTRNTRLRLGKTSSGEPLIQEIQIAGEKVRHVLTVNTRN
jgi:hypothetical protein